MEDNVMGIWKPLIDEERQNTIECRNGKNKKSDAFFENRMVFIAALVHFSLRYYYSECEYLIPDKFP
jgi:hypothetical protein